MNIHEYLKQLVADKLEGDTSRFAELWELEPELPAKLRSFDRDDGWLHWRPKTFDGWYCIAMPDGFGVYYQERGSKEPLKLFANERDAMTFALTSSVFSMTPPDNPPTPEPSLWQRLIKPLSRSR